MSPYITEINSPELRTIEHVYGDFPNLKLAYRILLMTI